MVHQMIAILFGLVFLAAGVMGLMPPFVTDNMLFGIFEISNAHNLVHLAIGLIALLSAASASYARLYFQVFGLIFAVAAVAGFLTGGNLLALQVNMADCVFLAVVAVFQLFFGFFVRAR